jgi:hypothetical protein
MSSANAMVSTAGGAKISDVRLGKSQCQNLPSSQFAENNRKSWLAPLPRSARIPSYLALDQVNEQE